MRILELNFEKGWRGGERQTVYALKGFKAAGVDIALLCRKNSDLCIKAQEAGIQVHAFHTIFGVMWFLVTKAKKFTVLHAQTSQILTFCVFTKLFHRAKVIYTRRVVFDQKGALTKLKYKYTDHIIAISSAVKNKLESFTGRNTIPVIPDIVEPKVLDNSRGLKLLKDFGVEGKYIIATVAVMNKEKDPMTTVTAIKLLSTKRNDFVFLHFGNGSLENEVKQKVNEYGLQHVYLLPGFKENIEDFYAIFNVFIITSIQEGMGSSVLDAFAYKVPVVATDAGGLTDLIANGRGVMCRVQAPQMVADSIDMVLNQTELKEQMINYAYQYAIDKHSMGNITAQYLALLK